MLRSLRCSRSRLQGDPGCRRTGIAPRRHSENFQVKKNYDKLQEGFQDMMIELQQY